MGFHRFGAKPADPAASQFSNARGEVLTGRDIEVGRLHFRVGEGAPAHHHGEEQVMYVVEGRLRVDLEGEVAELGPGEAFHALPDAPHELVALDDSIVLSLKSLVEPTHRPS